MKNFILFFTITILTIASCSKNEQISLVNEIDSDLEAENQSFSIDESYLILDGNYDWNNTKEDQLIYHSLKVSESFLQMNRSQAELSFTNIENEVGNFNSLDEYITYVSIQMNVSELEIRSFLDFYMENTELFAQLNESDFSDSMVDRITNLANKDLIFLGGADSDFRQCTGWQAVFGVAVIATTLISCGGCASGVLISCPGCATGIIGTGVANSCWFD